MAAGRWARPAGLAVAAAVVLGACGLRADERPQPIPHERLDNRLFSEKGDVPAGSQVAQIFVLNSQGGNPRLVATDVALPYSPDRERAALEALLTWVPPSNPGTNPRLTSRIPAGTVLQGASRDGDVLTVDLSNFSIEGPGQVQALAQIVFTATAVPGVERVVFTIDGKSVAVPLDNRSSTPGERLGRADFPNLEPLAPSPASTTTTAVAAPPTFTTTTSTPPAPAPAPGAAPAPASAPASTVAAAGDQSASRGKASGARGPVAITPDRG